MAKQKGIGVTAAAAAAAAQLADVQHPWRAQRRNTLSQCHLMSENVCKSFVNVKLTCKSMM